jgi:hypothetical protein
MLDFILSRWKPQAQMHCIMKERTGILLKTTTLHHEGKLARARFPYNTSTSALPKTIFHCERNLAHASIPFIVKEFTKTCPLPTTTLHNERKHNDNCIANNYITS